MHCFVTGVTGFIGKRLVKKLLDRKGSVVHLRIRLQSEGKVAALREFWSLNGRNAETRAVPVFGDLKAKIIDRSLRSPVGGEVVLVTGGGPVGRHRRGQTRTALLATVLA